MRNSYGRNNYLRNSDGRNTCLRNNHLRNSYRRYASRWRTCSRRTNIFFVSSSIIELRRTLQSLMRNYRRGCCSVMRNSSSRFERRVFATSAIVGDVSTTQHNTYLIRICIFGYSRIGEYCRRRNMSKLLFAYCLWKYYKHPQSRYMDTKRNQWLSLERWCRRFGDTRTKRSYSTWSNKWRSTHYF